MRCYDKWGLLIGMRANLCLKRLEGHPKLMLNKLNLLLQNVSSIITLKNIEDAFDQVNDVLDIEEVQNIPNDLLRMLQILASRVDLNGSETGGMVRNNIALILADVGPNYPVRGMRLANSKINSFDNDTFKFIVGDIDDVNQIKLANESDALVYLPESVIKSHRRISFIVFRNGRAFFSNKRNAIVNSYIVSVNVENITTFENGEVIDIYLRPFIADPVLNRRRKCVYWKFLENDTGLWSTDGCIYIRSTHPGNLDICRCDQLTHFPLILPPGSDVSERDEYALNIITLTGCILSIVGIIIIILTAIIFRSWRREFNNRVWLQLCIAILFLKVSFIAVVFSDFNGKEVSCIIIGVILHYSTLATFCWMLVAAIVSYRRLVLVFTKEICHRFLRALIFAWGTPMAIVAILFLVDHHSYTAKYDNNIFCYPSEYGLWLAVYAPVAIMLLANWIIFFMVIRSVFISRKSPSQGNTNKYLRIGCISCLLVFLFGLPWLLGFFTYNTVISYLFCFTMTFQGFMLFIFTILGNKQTRHMWLNKLKIKQSRTIPLADLENKKSVDENRRRVYHLYGDQ
ncbi:adhesion G-protein coupled receptor G2-like [Aphomia sociella]